MMTELDIIAARAEVSEICKLEQTDSTSMNISSISVPHGVSSLLEPSSHLGVTASGFNSNGGQCLNSIKMPASASSCYLFDFSGNGVVSSDSSTAFAPPDDHKLGQCCLWDRVRDQVSGFYDRSDCSSIDRLGFKTKIVIILDRKGIKLTSINLVRFGSPWTKFNNFKEENLDQIEADNNQLPALSPESMEKPSSSCTILIGILPDTISMITIHTPAAEIQKLLKTHDVTDVNIMFQEGVSCFSHNPTSNTALLAPSEDIPKEIGPKYEIHELLEPLSSSLSLPISVINTRGRELQGSLGFYFRVKGDLYGVSARHVCLPVGDGHDNFEYNYHGMTCHLMAKADEILTVLKTLPQRRKWLSFHIHVFKSTGKTSKKESSFSGRA